MRPSLQLRIGQHLTMTPQLQQAIKLLQLSTLDLQQEIQEALESNPLLEADDNQQQSNEASTTESNGLDGSEDATPTQDEITTSEALTQNEIPEELSVDSTWEESFSAGVSNTGMASGNDDTVYQGETTENIHDHLTWQMELTPFTETDKTIAVAIIDAIDDAGYLTVSTEDIQESLGDDEIELDEVEAVLKRIHMFDPIGSGACSIQHCLLIQLDQFDAGTPFLKEAKLVINNHIDLLANRDFRTIMRKTRLKEPQLQEVMRLIHSLNPRPGDAIVQNEEQYIIPDVSVFKKNGRWVVELNPETAPKLNINNHYASLAKTSSAEDSQFIRSHLQEAKWFIKSLESRNETLMKVSNCIVQQQQGFFEHGPEAMRPMVLNDVAEAVEMHESTISRVTTQKYMHTPRGIFELKYFFSSHVSTENGGECSSTAIRALIKKLVDAENPKKPLSDSKMAELLADQGINVARRTIAKYRESLGIPPSNQRKSLI